MAKYCSSFLLQEQQVSFSQLFNSYLADPLSCVEQKAYLSSQEEFHNLDETRDIVPAVIDFLKKNAYHFISEQGFEKQFRNCFPTPFHKKIFISFLKK